MSKSFGEVLKEVLVAHKICREDKFKGCSPEEIEAVMREQGVKRLPRIYREFLEVQGKEGLGENAYASSDWSCEVIGGLKEEAIRNRDSYDAEIILPEDMFVFFGHHDYEFLYFLTDNDDDNPPVYRFIAGHGKIELLAETLTEYYNLIVQYISRKTAKLDDEYNPKRSSNNATEA